MFVAVKPELYRPVPRLHVFELKKEKEVENMCSNGDFNAAASVFGCYCFFNKNKTSVFETALRHKQK